MGALKTSMMIFTLSACLGACAPTDSIVDAAPAHNARNSLDWVGTYSGILPCADCPGIATSVTLNADGTYSMRSRYIGKSAPVTASDGRFTWSADGRSILFSGAEPARFQVGESRLTRIALDGSSTTSLTPDHYVLTKANDPIREKYWKLVELRGQPVGAMEREPHLILKAEGDRVTGFAGCNMFNGRYVVDERTARIRFDQLVMTRVACSDGMQVERVFSQVLEQVDNYSLDGDHLSLNRARMAPLARFEAVQLP
ncbi:MAG: META domain-containing protein [Pseudomonadota bacterium]|uniref:META domain-containing protein n=1 Tax=Sphingobium naphthae TaxID=1886786 RepID=UPI002B18EE97|nr:META domain-containing protein [Pseudomonadota bacterium]